MYADSASVCVFLCQDGSWGNQTCKTDSSSSVSSTSSSGTSSSTGSGG
ncbi:hypothetical protein A7982_12632 [Minicystis rosea]|nr:hypothetical protein A7982_12632 [Minicystis rosea]